MKKMKLRCGADDPECGLSTGESALLLPDGPRILNCDICCTEAGFCRECRCLLCGLQIKKEERDRYEWIQCRQLVGAGKSAGMCGHSSHLECALDCRMAGVVSGEDGEFMLDAEYLCRRCDKKSDMECHLVLLVQAAQQGTRAVAERGLKLALRVMQGTTRSGIKGLELFIDKVTQEAEKGDDIRVVFDEYRNQALAADAARNGRT